MPKPLNRIQSDQAIAICSREHALQLVHYDHHRVVISQRFGVMLINDWLPVESHAGPFILTVVFHHVDNYPLVPEYIQSLVDGLKFQIRGQPR